MSSFFLKVVMNTCGRGLRCPRIHTKGGMKIELNYEAVCPSQAGMEAKWYVNRLFTMWQLLFCGCIYITVTRCYP